MRKTKNTVISEKNDPNTQAAENDVTTNETDELKEVSAPTIAEEVPEAKKATTKVKKTTTRKTTTKAAPSTSKKEKKPDAPKARTVNTHVELFVQYDGKEIAEQDIIERVRNIWVNELGNSPSKLKDVKIYFKPEENTVYYVWNDSDGGSFTL